VRIAVYTAVTAGYDTVPPPPTIPNVDFIAFLDDKSGAPGWQVRPFKAQRGHPPLLSPRMLAKGPKLLPHLFLPDYDATFWIDGSHRIKSPTFIAEALPFAEESGFALHRHPWRNCIYEEAQASLELWKYNTEPIEDQVEQYRRDGHPAHWGLWACGSMLRLKGHPKVDAAMEQWWTECLLWSYQDQLSLPPVLRALDLVPGEFPHHQVFDNPWFEIRAHPRNNE
jgi:hypothetical protein